MHESSDAPRVDEGVPLSIKIMILIAFLVLAYVLLVDVFGFFRLI
jgi:hypothetical protein